MSIVKNVEEVKRHEDVDMKFDEIDSGQRQGFGRGDP